MLSPLNQLFRLKKKRKKLYILLFRRVFVYFIKQNKYFFVLREIRLFYKNLFRKKNIFIGAYLSTVLKFEKIMSK
jgi:hypothetical protein